MDFSNKNILVLTDGSDGMVSQVYGLAQEFSKKIIPIKTKLIFPWSKIQPGILPIFKWIFLNNLNFNNNPDIVISCGRKSVYLSLYIKKKYKNIISIHIQNPKTNFKKFDYIVAPEHDMISGYNIIKTVGALHRFNNNLLKEVVDNKFKIPKKNLISLIIGGNNNHYKFSIKELNILIIRIQNLKKTNPEYNILILYSRRTNKKMKDLLRKKLGKISTIPRESDENPYTFALKYSKFFIVTSDSTSMISECAFTGTSIYIFHLPFKRKSKRINRFHEKFNKLNITKNFDHNSDLISWKYKSINESERIASILKERIIKENS